MLALDFVRNVGLNMECDRHLEGRMVLIRSEQARWVKARERRQVSLVVSAASVTALVHTLHVSSDASGVSSHCSYLPIKH